MAERIEAIKVSLNQTLNDKEKPWKKALDLAEEKTGVPRLYLFAGKLFNVYQNIQLVRIFFLRDFFIIFFCSISNCAD